MQYALKNEVGMSAVGCGEFIQLFKDIPIASVFRSWNRVRMAHVGLKGRYGHDPNTLYTYIKFSKKKFKMVTKYFL